MFKYNSNRRDPETIKREGWRDHGILVVSPADDRLTWPERELVKQLGEKLYGKRPLDAAMDTLLEAIATAVSTDRTLGGLCDRVTPQVPDTSMLSIDGAPQIKGAVIPIELIYTTSDYLA